MMDGQFDVVFRGQIIKSMPLAEVKSNLVTLFKSSPDAVEKLFIGSEVTIKKSLDYSMAMKYQSALKKAGALALIKEVEKPDSLPQEFSKSKGRANYSTETQTPVAEQKPELAKPAATPIKISETVPGDELVEEQTDIAEQEMTLAPAGASILPDKVYEKRDIDTSDLSLAAVGERILPKKAPDNHPQPWIDHLKLEY